MNYEKIIGATILILILGLTIHGMTMMVINDGFNVKAHQNNKEWQIIYIISSIIYIATILFIIWRQ